MGKCVENGCHWGNNPSGECDEPVASKFCVWLGPRVTFSNCQIKVLQGEILRKENGHRWGDVLSKCVKFCKASINWLLRTRRAES